MDEIQKYHDTENLKCVAYTVSPIRENPNMDNLRLESVKKFFRKIEFLKMSKSEKENVYGKIMMSKEEVA